MNKVEQSEFPPHFEELPHFHMNKLVQVELMLQDFTPFLSKESMCERCLTF